MKLRRLLSPQKRFVSANTQPRSGIMTNFEIPGESIVTRQEMGTHKHNYFKRVDAALC